MHITILDQQPPPGSVASAYPQAQFAFAAPSSSPSFYSQPGPNTFPPAYNQPLLSSSPSSHSPMAAVSVSNPPPPPSQSYPTPQSQVQPHIPLPTQPTPPPNQSTPPQQPLQQQINLQQQPRPAVPPTPKPILQPPLSPTSAKLESQRVTALLEINRALIHEILLLQAAGRAGAPAQTPAQQGQPPGQVSPAGAEADAEAKKESGDGKDGASCTDGAASKVKPAVSSREYIEYVIYDLLKPKSIRSYIQHIGNALLYDCTFSIILLVFPFFFHFIYFFNIILLLSTFPLSTFPFTGPSLISVHLPALLSPFLPRPPFPLAAPNSFPRCMRRLQCNLAYLASIADRSHKPASAIPAMPAIMDPPPPVPGNTIGEEGMKGLGRMYEELRGLYRG